MVAIVPISTTAARLMIIFVVSDAFILKTRTNKSWLTDEAATSSCESAVEQMAARMAAMIMPPMKPGTMLESRAMIGRVCSGCRYGAC